MEIVYLDRVKKGIVWSWEFQWLVKRKYKCLIHNVLNSSLGKFVFGQKSLIKRKDCEKDFLRWTNSKSLNMIFVNSKLELDSTMSQSRVVFWNWIFSHLDLVRAVYCENLSSIVCLVAEKSLCGGGWWWSLEIRV